METSSCLQLRLGSVSRMAVCMCLLCMYTGIGVNWSAWVVMQRPWVQMMGRTARARAEGLSVEKGSIIINIESVLGSVANIADHKTIVIVLDIAVCGCSPRWASASSPLRTQDRRRTLFIALTHDEVQ